MANVFWLRIKRLLLGLLFDIREDFVIFTFDEILRYGVHAYTAQTCSCGISRETCSTAFCCIPMLPTIRPCNPKAKGNVYGCLAPARRKLMKI